MARMKQGYIVTINYTHRTPTGHKARIICTDFQHTAANATFGTQLCTIAAVLDLDITGAESLVFLTQDLRKTATSPTPYLNEYNPWHDVAIDTPVWCRDNDDDEWCARHFSGIDQYGELTAWENGCTSHTGDQKLPWGQMTLTNPNTDSEQAK